MEDSIFFHLKPRAAHNVAWIDTWLVGPDGAYSDFELTEWRMRAISSMYPEVGTTDPGPRPTSFTLPAHYDHDPEFLAAIALLHTCGPESVRHTEVNTNAHTRAQALEIFQLASDLLATSAISPDDVEDDDETGGIYCEELDVTFRPHPVGGVLPVQ